MRCNQTSRFTQVSLVFPAALVSQDPSGAPCGAQWSWLPGRCWVMTVSQACLMTVAVRGSIAQVSSIWVCLMVFL